MAAELIVHAPAHLAAARPPSHNPARVYLASLAPGSRPTMRQALGTIAEAAAPGADLDSFPWHALRYAHVQAIRSQLAERYSAPTANKMLAALRQTLRAAWRLGQMTAEECQAACDVRNVQGARPEQAAGRALALGELMSLAAACSDGTPAGARDGAILAVSYACGLRRAEIVALDLAHVDQGATRLLVRGKGGKVRTVPMEPGAAAAVEDWLAVRGAAPGPLFVPIRSGGRLQLRRLTTQGVYVALARRAAAAGVPHFTPHDLRRTFAGDLLDAGADIATVQKLMGHASVATTAGYDRRGERAKAEAAKKLHFPYQRKGRK